MEQRIHMMLRRAYRRLGIRETEMSTWIRRAKEYLQQDREHYVEMTDEEEPDYQNTLESGQICRMVPLGRQVIRDQGKDCDQEYTMVLSLMVTEDTVRYIGGYTMDKLFRDPRENQYGYPIYCETALESIKKTMQPLPPQEIRPLATPRDWEIYGMVFMGIARFARQYSLNFIPHKTERAVRMLTHILETELTVGDDTLRGKLLPLARDRYEAQEYGKDYSHSSRRELCLLVTSERQMYLLKTYHTYQYFKKVELMDKPGTFVDVPQEDKQTITYAYTTLEQIRGKMHLL